MDDGNDQEQLREITDRYERVADRFTAAIAAVPPDRWGSPAPCEGWVARDVVDHLVEWLSDFFYVRWDLRAPPPPPVEDGPAEAWAAVDGALRAALADPAVALAERDTPMGPMGFAAALDMICTSDVLVHTWDLAQATGTDETLDPVEVSRLLVSMEAADEAMRASGHYGPRVPVPEGASEQDQLIAFVGRQP